ncbi:hypothetical protein BJ166DRAFT_497989 [Pestalotiopsis sp. NC0098]|nr:hypothetical protein BJ166DRAFT_497989 [Pestalotiopsis sp. NC0098]
MSISRLCTALACLIAVTRACLTPGEDAPGYTDGSFTIPSGNTPTYTAGTKMNISWTTDFQSSTLWLITGCDFAAPTKSIVVGSSQTWTEWEVDTTSTNSSEIYLFRVVDSLGSTSEQQNGGFLSAGFYISGGPTSSSSSSSSKTTSSATSGSSLTALASPTSAAGKSVSATGTEAGTSQTSPANMATSSTQASTSSSELSTGAKAGIGVGISVGVVGVAALVAAFLMRRKSKHEAVPNPALQETMRQQEWKDSQQQQPYAGGYQTGQNSMYDGQYSEMHGTPVPYRDGPPHVSELPNRHNPQQPHQGPVYEM